MDDATCELTSPGHEHFCFSHQYTHQMDDATCELTSPGHEHFCFSHQYTHQIDDATCELTSPGHEHFCFSHQYTHQMDDDTCELTSPDHEHFCFSHQHTHQMDDATCELTSPGHENFCFSHQHTHQMDDATCELTSPGHEHFCLIHQHTHQMDDATCELTSPGHEHFCFSHRHTHQMDDATCDLTSPGHEHFCFSHQYTHQMDDATFELTSPDHEHFCFSHQHTHQMDDATCELTSPGHEHCLLSELYNLQQQGYMCDVILTAHTGMLTVHTAVLVAASPYFKQRLSPGSMLSEHNVMVDDVDIGVLAAVVRFIYTGRLTVSRDNVKQIKTFCKEVNLDEAVKMCQSYTDNILSQSEVVTVIKEENAGTISVHGNGISESLSPRRQAAPRGNDKKGSKRKRTCAVTENNVDDLEKRKQSLDNILAQSLNVSTSNISLNTTKASLSKEKSSSDKTVANTCNKRTKCAKVVGKGRKSKTKKLSSVSKLKGRNKTSRSNCDKTSGNSSGFEKCAKGSREAKGDRFSNSGTAEMCLDKTLNVYEDSANEDDCIEFVDDPDSESHVDGYCSTEGTDPLRTNIKPKLRVKKIKDVYPRNCELCNEMLPDLKSVKSHMKLQHKESTGRSRRKCNSDNWPCSVCGRLLTSAVRQACHLYSKHGMPYDSTFKLYACDVEECKYVTASKHYLQIHNKGRHGNERPHVCHYCGKGFKLPSALSTHLNIHTKVLVHKCEECGLTFNQKGGLEVHIKKHHTGEASWTELCHLCSDKFMQKAELCWHMYKTHSIPLPDRYKVCSCDFCDYQTIRKNKMQRHMDAHDEVRNYSCLVCGKKFVTKSYLNRHVRYHGEKSFKCDYDGCTYCCVDRVGLNKHIRLVHTHKNYKPFVCSLCPYKSGLRGNLDKHIRTVHNLEVVTKHTVQLKMKFKDRVSGDIITKDGQYIHKVVDQRGMSHLQCLEMEPADPAVPETCDRDHRLELGTADIEKPSTIIAGRPATPLPHDTAPPPPHDLPGYLFSTGQLIQPGTAEPSSQLAGPYTTVGAAGVAPQGDQAIYTNVNPMAFVTNVPKFANYY